MIRLQALGFSYNGRPLLRQLDLAIPAGDLLTVMGPNGSGKSTLLRLLRGRLQPQQGQVLWPEGEAHRLSRLRMAQLVAVVPQQLEQPFGFPVRELVAMGLYARRRGLAAPGRRDWLLVDEALQRCDVGHLAGRTCARLSGGELQRVLLARALVQQTPVLLLDEATSQLDMGHRDRVALLLQQLCYGEGKTIIQVSHDLNAAAQLSRRVLLLSAAGQVLALGEPRQVLTAENIRRAYGVEVEILAEADSLRILPRPLPAWSGQSLLAAGTQAGSPGVGGSA